jgi:hypothetical protein
MCSLCYDDTREFMYLGNKAESQIIADAMESKCVFVETPRWDVSTEGDPGENHRGNPVDGE